jgi:hypothetical protein
VLQEAELVHQLTVRYQVESAKAGLLQEESARSEQDAQSLRTRARSTESLLRQEALLSYADELPVVLPAATAEGRSLADLVDETDQATYLSLTIGDISDTLDQLQTEQSELAGALVTTREELQGDMEAVNSAAAARNLALQEAASLQTLLSTARSQVAALTAAQRAAAERARTGPPVGNGIVKALAQQLGVAPASLGADGPGRATAPPSQAPVLASAPARTTSSATTAARVTTTVRFTRAVRATTTAPPTTTGAGATTTAIRGITSASAATTATTPTTTPLRPTTSAPPASSTTTSSSSTTTATTAPTTTTTTPPQAAVAPTATTLAVQPPPLGGAWLELRECESGDNYQADTGNGYYGAYQFSWSTWVNLGYPGRPDQEPYWMQDQAAQRLEAAAGWGQWPSCTAALGL